MGADIHGFAEYRHTKDDHIWIKNEEKVFGLPDYPTVTPFSTRNYSVFGFLADVRNYSEAEPIVPVRGLPNDSQELQDPDTLERALWDNHSHTWITLEELMLFDYDAMMENRRISVQTGLNIFHGAGTAEPGGGTLMTYREFLGSLFFSDLEALQTLGEPENVRIVIWFDN